MRQCLVHTVAGYLPVILAFGGGVLVKAVETGGVGQVNGQCLHSLGLKSVT